MPDLLSKPAFTLIEIVISLFIILAIITIIFAASTTYTASRGTNLQGTATKIASRQMETIRSTGYASLPSCPSPAGCTLSDADITQLPSGSANQFIDSYQGSPDIMLVSIQVNWTVSGADKQIKLESLKYKNGL